MLVPFLLVVDFLVALKAFVAFVLLALHGNSVAFESSLMHYIFALRTLSEVFFVLALFFQMLLHERNIDEFFAELAEHYKLAFLKVVQVQHCFICESLIFLPTELATRELLLHLFFLLSWSFRLSYLSRLYLGFSSWLARLLSRLLRVHYKLSGRF